jgi:probable phosphomutase (TIGR03848 family)
MTRFLLIRHAVTDSVGKRLSGRASGVHLNETGKVQAQALAERLASVPLAAIYSSPLERALETAAPLATLRQLETEIAEDFLEVDFGAWTNRTFQELDGEPQFKLFNTFRSSTRIPDGELMAEAQNRIISGLQKLTRKHWDETVAIVSHADLIKAAVAFYAGIHLDLFQRIEISPASVSVLEIYDETARLLHINDTGGIKV